MAARCDECRRPFGMSRRPVQSYAGRQVCEDCRARTTGHAAGLLAGGGIAGAIATEGWYQRLRARRRGRRRTVPPRSAPPGTTIAAADRSAQD